MGIRILKEREDTGPEDNDLFTTVIGTVKDVRDFQEEEVKEWIILHWMTYDEIRVK